MFGDYLNYFKDNIFFFSFQLQILSAFFSHSTVWHRVWVSTLNVVPILMQPKFGSEFLSIQRNGVTGIK